MCNCIETAEEIIGKNTEKHKKNVSWSFTVYGHDTTRDR